MRVRVCVSAYLVFRCSPKQKKTSVLLEDGEACHLNSILPCSEVSNRDSPDHVRALQRGVLCAASRGFHVDASVTFF